MADQYILGIDIGTSSTKTILAHKISFSIISQASQEYSIDIPKTGWAEQQPEIWWNAVVSTVRRVLNQSAVLPDEIAVIGLSGQMHSTVCLDERGEVVRPAIIWADQRSHRQVDDFYRKIGKAYLASCTRNPLATGFMLATWMWLRENEPETCGKTSYLLSPKDYIRYKMTGRIGTEPSDAVATLMFDPIKKDWCLPLLEALEIPEKILPDVHPSSAIGGGLNRQSANALSLLHGTPVIYGGGDQAIQAYGNGIIDPGAISCTIGTGGQIFTPIDKPKHDELLRLHLFNHIIPNRWYLLAATLSAGLSLRWVRDKLFPGSNYQSLADIAAHVDAGADGLFFLPYLIGERTPHMNANARAGFIGLSIQHTQAHIVRSVMEGVVFSLRQSIEIIGSMGIHTHTITASGGGTRHSLWLQLQADIFNRQIRKPVAFESAAFGAVLFAAAAIGTDTNSYFEKKHEQQVQIISPEPATVEIYEKQYRCFCRLYPALNSIDNDNTE